jgi:hypothetical protein
MRTVVLPTTHQEVHVTFSQEGLTRLKLGLERAGLDAKFFPWPPDGDPQRPPYRGLKPLEAEDAGIFFGREAATIEALDRLRGLKDVGPPRFLIVLGASGAGKSSFLRAGLLPRLARDDRNFLPLPVLRPECAAISGETGLLRALETGLREYGLIVPRADIRRSLRGGAANLQPLLVNLIEKAYKAIVRDEGEAPRPFLVLPIDQSEELLLGEGAAEGETLLALLKDLLAEDSPGLLVLATIRSDSYERLQTAKALEGIPQQTLSLSPMPRSSFRTIIEGPAQRLKETDRPLIIEPALTQALLADIEEGGGSDTLPLLAFTLERLYLEYGARGCLTFADYDALGRIKGSIESAVERALLAADKDARIPKDHEARLSLLRRGLIPWLAGVDPETKMARRRIARAAQIPQDARALIDLLVEQRLLTRDVDEKTDEATIEPSHEALLRQWGELKRWVAEDFGCLAALEGLQRAARDWDEKARDPAWVVHGGARLGEAEVLDARPDLAAMLEPRDRAYLSACREKEDRAQQVRRHAEERSALLAAHASLSLTEEGSLDAALLLLLDSANLFDDQSVPDEIRIAFTKALEKKARLETRTLFPNMQVFETDAALLLVNPATNDIWKLTDAVDPVLLMAGSRGDSNILAMRLSARATRFSSYARLLMFSASTWQPEHAARLLLSQRQESIQTDPTIADQNPGCGL